MTNPEETLALPVGVTLDRFIKRNQEAFPFATGGLSQLVRDIALADELVNREVNRAGLVDVTGGLGTSNGQSEAQQKLNVTAYIRFPRALRNGSEVVGALVVRFPDSFKLVAWTRNNASL